jgi:hypothetical protein
MQVHLSDCRTSDPVQSGLASNKLQLCMLFLENISPTYWSAGVMFRLFERAQHILRNTKRKNNINETQKEGTSTKQRSRNIGFPESFVETREARPTSHLLEPEPPLIPDAVAPLWINDEGMNNANMSLNAIDQLLHPDFSLPDDDYSALFPGVMFGKADQSQADPTIDTINLFNSA